LGANAMQLVAVYRPSTSLGPPS